jgi:hypothetical protein
MSHFTVLVIGDDVEGQLAKYDENIEAEPYWRLEAESVADHWATAGWIEEGKLPENPTMEQVVSQCIADWGESLDEYKVEDGKLYQRSTYNKLSKWDWYEIGGRWRGFFTLKSGVTVGGLKDDGLRGFPDPAVLTVGEYDGSQSAQLGTPGTGETLAIRDGEDLGKNYAGQADQARKGDIDFELMRVLAGAEAQVEYDTFAAATKDIPSPGTWVDHYRRHVGDLADREFRDMTESEKETYKAGMDTARETWQAEPFQQTLREAGIHMFFDDAHTYFCLDAADPRSTFIEKAVDRAGSPFAVIKDGEWFAKGDMGWWGIVSDEKDQTTWNKRVRDLIDTLPDDTLLTLIDAHI